MNTNWKEFHLVAEPVLREFARGMKAHLWCYNGQSPGPTIEGGKLGMNEGMTMVFAAKDPALLNNVKAGDKVKFDAERVNGQFTATKIEKR
jgi:hypothetical protein